MALDRMCVGIADADMRGGEFGQSYQLDDLPQTLRVEPGGAHTALAWVRGDRAGVPVARASHAIDFSDDVTLALDKCVVGPAAAPHTVGDPVGAPGALLAASQGQGGTVVAAATAGALAIIDAQSGALVASDGPAITGNPLAIVAADVDGDCDDDLVVVTDGGPPQIFIRDKTSFTAAGTLGTTLAATAIAAADVDGDGSTDLVIGGAGTLELWLNDGNGTFTKSGALAAGGHVAAVSALAIGDVDHDGVPDLVVGQSGSGAPLAAYLGSPGGAFAFSTALIAPIPLDVERFTMADADGDFLPDLAIAARGSAMRLFIDRDSLEDHSQVALPQPAAVAHAIAIGGWDAGCPPDLVIASDAGSPALDGQNTGTFGAEAPGPSATDVVLADIDDDGDLDALFATPNGVVWLAR